GPNAPGGDEVPEDPAVHLKPLEPMAGEWSFGSAGQFRADFQWKGNNSCLAYRTFSKESGGEEVVMGTGLIFWDAAVGAIPETCFDQPSDQFQNGIWKPDGKRLVRS